MIKFLSNQQEINLPEDIGARVSLLIDYLRSSRCLLILDNAESILQGDNHAGQYREGCEDYGQLIQRIADTSHQSCLILTSREKPGEIAASVSELCRDIALGYCRLHSVPMVKPWLVAVVT
jgi:hypothetical protein